jgi:mgtE-like transporter
MYAKEMIRQILPLIIFCGFGAIVAGHILGLIIDLFKSIPGLIVVIPAIIAMRGNISTALASRLGSAYHLGIINADNLWNDELKQNLIGSFILNLFITVFIGLLAYVSSILIGVYPNPFKLISIVILSAIISGIILMMMTIAIIYLVFKRGYNPDNITGPTLATFGDMITISCISFSALFIEVIL